MGAYHGQTLPPRPVATALPAAGRLTSAGDRFSSGIAMIRALVLDFDGLILDTETVLIDSWVQIHVRHGLPCSRAEAHRLVGQVGVAYDPWVAFGSAADRAALDAEHKRIYRELTLRQPVLPGVRELLAAGRAQGLKLGVASSSSHRHVDGHLERLGLFARFDCVRCRDDVARTKPAPDLYVAVIARLGCPPAEVIAFEDSTPGVQAAKAAGLWVVAVPNPSTLDHDLGAADLVVPSLAAVSLADLLGRFADAGRAQ
jgi:putative hydrolase of the HAD superfamily